MAHTFFHRPLRRLLAAVAALLLPLGAAAQTFSLRVGGGLATRYTASRPVGAYSIGVEYEHEFGQHWTFNPTLAYTGKGYRLPDETVVIRDDEGEPVVDDDGRTLTGVKRTSTTAAYVQLSLPFSYYLRTGTARYVVLSAGPFAGIGVAGQRTVKGDTDLQGAERMFSQRAAFGTGGLRRLEAGLEARAAYQWSRRWTLGLEGQFPLTRLAAGEPRAVAALVTLAYRFRSDDFRPARRKNHHL